MNTKLILKAMIFDFAFQLAIATPPAKAQSNNQAPDAGMVNAHIDAMWNLQVTASKSSSKNDFDFFTGAWDVAARKLKARLQHSNEWITFSAKLKNTTILRGIGNTEPYYAKINGKDFEGYTLRLFDPKTRLWSIYWADSNNGKMDPPQVGSFENNIGLFYAKDTWEGKNVIVVFKWDKTNPEQPTWSQAFSTDNGKTWEWNWYHTFTKSNPTEDIPFSENQNIKVLELRNYILKPGKRDEFINYFEKHFVTSQNILGGYVLGQFSIKGADNRFLWFRGFNDMSTRSVYLPEFYRKSLVWKKFGPGANELLDDNDDVHLLRPLNDINGTNELSKGISTNDFAKHKGIVVIDYYTANEGQLDALIGVYKSKALPAAPLNNTTLWVSELTQNDYPSLPVIQDKNLLVVISFYKDEADYQSQSKLASGNKALQDQIKNLTKNIQTMIVYPTEKSFGELAD
ncbi:MAG TPA: hypothetical protein VK668_09925 [Mucilaginibacter sp.]|nr:hypothetical protein [Mucilaginibacter sp.]